MFIPPMARSVVTITYVHENEYAEIPVRILKVIRKVLKH